MTSPSPSVPARRSGARRGPAAAGAPRHGAGRDSHVLAARRWTAGGLAASTLVALGVVGWFLWTLRATSPEALLGAAAMLLPGLLVGWCTGFAALAVLVRDELFPPRPVGLVAALVGSVLGAAVLPLAGVALT